MSDIQDQNVLNIKIFMDPNNNNTVYYQFNENQPKPFIENTGGKTEFKTDLSDIINGYYPQFLPVYTQHSKATSITGKATSITGKATNIFSKFISTPATKVYPERTTGGKKTKSNRSYNANKTLKNRK